jgi:bacterioferritin-associated ferredoxin
MIICVCHRVSDRDIRQAISNGADSVEALGEQLGACTGCGCCRESCEELLETFEASRAMPIAA